MNQSWGIASMVCGILSLLLFLAPYFGLPLAVFAVVAAYKQNKIFTNGYSTAGNVIGIIGIIINSISTLFIIVMWTVVGLFV